VPAFEPGRLRGLGLVPSENDPKMTTLAPAWNKNAAGDVTLPVYYHWEFSTSPKGDFESLCRRLRTPGSYKGTPVEDLLKKIGTIPMEVDDLLNGSTPGLVTTMEGAFVPIKYTPGAPPPDVQAESLEIIVNTPQDQVANPVGDGPTNAEGRRLEVKPPMYGAWHAQQHQVFRAGVGPASAPKLGKHWLADLNLNPRYRGAAGYGAEVVRKYQEDYVDACWDQIGDVLDAEMKFNLTRLAIEALGALKRKHFDVLPPERMLQVFGPALPRIEALGNASQTYRINGQIASVGGRLARSSMPVAMVDTAMRRVASPANRSLRMAARLNASIATLPTVLNSYVTTMAKATRKADAFSVNAFTPDGIIGTKMFNGLDLSGPATSPLDLSTIGLRGERFTVGDVTQTLSRAREAQRGIAKNGVPGLTIREGQHLGVFTDLHSERFGMLAASSPTVKSSDWMIVASQVESLGDRGVEGFLVESNTSTAMLQVHSMRLDSRTGHFTVDQIAGRFNAARKAMSLTATGRVPGAGPLAALAGTQLGQISVGQAREFDATSLFTALPPNAMTTAAGAPVQTFTLNANFEFERVQPPGRVPPVVSITIPPAIRDREVLNRFSAATKGAQATWADAFAARRVEVQVIDFPLAQVATVVRARTEPGVTLPARLASTVSVAQFSVNQATSHVSAFLPKKTLVDHRFMIPKLFDRVMAWPHLRNAMYKDLAAYDKNAFMPGIDDLPQDLIMLVQVNQYFIDAFMAGANFEMNRELLWRAFPTDLRGTPFQRFWDRRRYTLAGVTYLNDMEPMHQWRKQPLGERTDENMLDPDRVALLVRGQLLLRYPNTAVYAWKKRTTPQDPNPESVQHTMLLKDNNGNPPSKDDIQVPVFSGFIPPDVTFFGFDINKKEIKDWCFVLEEQMTEPRFGFDVPATPQGQPQGTSPLQRGALKSALALFEPMNSPLRASGYNPYKALSWTHLQVAAGGFASVSSLITVPDKPFASFPTLAADATAADIAKALIQEPFRAYYLGNDLA